ncbi:MAG: hypothetical protein ACQESK_03725 [Bacteroidota bacterium]
MKYLYTILIFILPFTISAQVGERVLIEGKVNVPIDDDAENISVYNETSNFGAITNEYGEFRIYVAVNDKITFSALQYEDFTVLIDENIVKKKKMTVSVKTSEKPLDEVIVKPYDLSGNIEVDITKTKTQTPSLSDIDSKEIVFGHEGEIRDDANSQIRRVIADQQYVDYGLDVASIFRTIFNRSKKENGRLPNDIDVNVRKMYNDDFFKENLDIKRENINEFIYFAQENGLNNEMLQKENELDLIDFLVHKADQFKAQKND